MPTTSSPLDDILSFITGHLVIIIVVLVWFFSMIGRAMRGSARPPAVGPRPVPRPVTPSAAPPARPVAAPQPARTGQAPGQRFRPQPQGRSAPAQSRPGSSSERMGQKRAEIERFAEDENELDAAEPQAPGLPRTSSATLFDQNGPLGGQGAGPSLLRAIVLAEALGRRRPPFVRANKRPPASDA